MGDTSQTDFSNRGKSVLPKLMNTFSETPEVGVIKFNEDDCVRNPIIPYMLNKIKEMEEKEHMNKNN